MSEEEVLDEDSLQQIYTWIDEVPLSRPKKNIARDFSDGVLIAEIIHHFLPKMVDLHNYSNAHATAKKMDNWNVLGRKCFNKLSFNVKDSLVKGAVFCEPGAVELILRDLRYCIEAYSARKKAQAMMEKNEIHDELSHSGNSQSSQHDHVFQGHQYEGYAVNGYQGPTYDHTSGPPMNEAYYNPQMNPHIIQQPLQNAEQNGNVQYNYQSQPHAVNDKSSSKSGDKQSPTRKPVTQAVKYSKPKRHDSKDNITGGNPDVISLRLALEEKEQALLASQETVQILQAKIRRLEHLLHLKDLRLNEAKKFAPPTQQPIGIQQPQHPPPLRPPAYRHLHPNQMHPTGGVPMPPPQSIQPQQQFGPMRPPLPQIARSPGEDQRKYPR